MLPNVLAVYDVPEGHVALAQSVNRLLGDAAAFLTSCTIFGMVSS